jgi:hypothetical protein
MQLYANLVTNFSKDLYELMLEHIFREMHWKDNPCI